MQPIDTTYSIPPFPAFPSTSRYVPLGSVQDAFTRICRSVDGSEAVSLVIGPPGTGKSLLCGLIAQRYRSSHEVVVLGETRLENRDAFLRHLLHHLQVDVSKTADGDLQLAVIDRVCGDEVPEGGLLIIVDEAQSLSAEVFEAIRMVTNTMRNGIPRVSAVVCGGVKIDDLLIESSMEPFVQRVATRCYLHPMNGEETREYICETIRQCGADPAATVNETAISNVHNACSGVPRLINQLMTQAIDCAEEADQSMISDQIIELAWSQLQQLPSPMVEEPRITSESTSVEFGELDDDFASPAEPLTDEVEKHHASENEKRVTSLADRESFEDIVVEGTTAQWLAESESDDRIADDPAENVDAAVHVDTADELTAPPETIVWETEQSSDNEITDDSVFGDFEHEEDIAVGSAVESGGQPAAEPQAELEQMLHQEIVGINETLHELLNPSTEDDPFYISEETIGEESIAVEEPEETIEDFLNPPTEHTQEDDARDVGPSTQETDTDTEGAKADEPEAVSSLLWIGDVEPTSDEGEDAAVRDDSDILVIEDEVEIRRIDAAKRYDSLDQTISVDFHAMLTRMRQGS